MRESEVDGYNGVIWYLAGTWAVLRFFPKDIGTMGVLLLSWCDVAASTLGRAYGRYTWPVRKGKSLAGSAAALVTGVITAWVFWGWAVPAFGTANGYDLPPNTLAFQGALELPSAVKGLLGWKETEGIIRGPLAVGVLSLWTGLIASASEAVDIFNWDDNFTIPVLCGVGIYGFLKAFGTAA
jgi:diacylglycerol kinase (CTP)